MFLAICFRRRQRSETALGAPPAELAQWLQLFVPPWEEKLIFHIASRTQRRKEVLEY